MKRRFGYVAAALVAAGLAAAVVQVQAAPVPPGAHETIKDRKDFIPHSKYEPLKGKAVGLLVSDVGAKMAHDGRGGPPDAMGFSAGSNSYRWVYVPVTEKPLITGLRVKTGEKGDGVKVYDKLSMANAQTVQGWKIDAAYALVEVEVNDGLGAPADEGFVATKMTRIDGTKEFPLDVAKSIKELKEKYAEWQKSEEKKLDEALADSGKKAIGDKKPTGPREKNELMYVTWLPDRQVMRVHFRTTVTDGDYKFSGGGADRERPVPLPPAKPQELPVAYIPPPLEQPAVRYGTQYGIEYGVAYEVGKTGKVEKTLVLSAEAFKNELPPPPAVGPRGGQTPVDPPPPPKPGVKKN